MRFTSSTRATRIEVAAVDGHGPALDEGDRDVLGVDGDRGVPEPHAHDRLDDLHGLVEVLEGLRLVRRAPDVGVGGVGLLLAGPVGEVALREPGAHLVPTAELRDELRVQPGLVDAQVGVGQQAVAVEALDVVALERRPVAPDLHLVRMHGSHEQRAGDRAAQRRGVEVGLAATADVEGATGDRREPFLDEGVPAVDEPGELGAVLPRPVRHRLDLGLVVLPEVRGVGAGDRPLLPHPGDRDGCVEASRERDADTLADRERRQDLGHECKSIQRLA